jgi:hypothetical protein
VHDAPLECLDALVLGLVGARHVERTDGRRALGRRGEVVRLRDLGEGALAADEVGQSIQPSAPL